MVRFVVLQESKITASVTAPPAPHNMLSRLPWIHRASLEPHTNREYAQKREMLTTHFFGRFLTRRSEFCRPRRPIPQRRDIVSAIYPKIF